VSVTSPVSTVITDTLLAAAFATYAFVPSGLNATETGASPTSIVEVTLGAATAGAGTDTTIINDNSARDSVGLRSIIFVPFYLENTLENRIACQIICP
jgi:hypothetical protein